MYEREQPRVAVLCGGLPADVRHLSRAAEEVDLHVYRSSWMHQRSATSQESPVGVTVRSFPPVVRLQRGHLTFAYRGLRRRLDEDVPDVVHVISEPWGLLALQAANWVRKRPNSRLVLHGCDTIWHHGSLAKRVVRRALLGRTLPVTDAWVAENGKALALGRPNGLPESAALARIHTNPRDGRLFRWPSPEERARARAALGVADGDIAVGLIGRLVPQKGVALFLDAAESLLRAGFAGRFLIAGTGPMADEVLARASDRIRPLMHVAHPHGVVDLLRALDVIACPSLTTPTWEDQAPRAVLEAMMSGCIPVGTPTGGIPEMLGGRGVLAASTGVGDLAVAIERAAELSRDLPAREDLAEWAAAQFSGDAVGGQLLDVWRSVLAQRPARCP